MHLNYFAKEIKMIKKTFSDFKEFIAQGNVIDLAVGIIIGGAFQSIVSSLVNDILSPVIGLFTQKDFSGWSIKIGEAEIKYGSFITAIINFLIMALVIFFLVKTINRIMSIGKKEEPEEVTTKKCPYCLSEIPIEATKCPHCTSELETEE